MIRDFRLLVALTVTGAAALALEVIWSRALIPWVGGMAMAQLATVGVYMLGLFVGSVVAARYVDFVWDPRKLFLRVEAAAAIVSGAMILALPLADPLFRFLAQGKLLSGGLGAGFRGLAGGSLIFPATFLMGVGLPMAIKSLQGRGAGPSAAAWVYGVNTAGAAIGAFVGGFLLVPGLGILWGTVAVVAVDLIVLFWAGKGQGDWATRGLGERATRGLADEGTGRQGDKVTRREGEMARWGDGEIEDKTGEQSPGLRDREIEGQTGERSSGLEEPAMLLAVFFGGFVALGLEAILFRLLGLVLGPTARAFTVVVTSYVLGLGLGALAVGRVIKSPDASRKIFIGSWLAVGILIAFLHGALEMLPGPISQKIVLGSASLGVQLLTKALVAVVILLPMTFAFGSAYASAVAAGGAGSAVRAARLYASLTLGNITGVAVTAIWIIPGLGLENGLWLLAGMACLVPIPALAGSGYKNAYKGALVAVAGIVAMAGPLLSESWDWKKILSAPYMYRGTGLNKVRQIVFKKEDFGVTVTVLKDRDRYFFSVDGKVDGGNSVTDKITQSLLGVLPTALHHNPQSVLVIGLGTGQTASEVLKFPVAKLFVAEITPAVEQCLSFFKDINRGFWMDPRYNLIRSDGRTVMRYGPDKYDVIISEPSNVWVPGVAHLFTRQAFVEARDVLNKPHGMFLQWLHAYRLDPKAFRLVLRTFMDVFPYVTLWSPGPNAIDAFFLGSFEAPSISLPALRKRMARAQVENFMAPGRKLNEISLLRTFVAGPEKLSGIAGEGPLLSDSRPLLDYLGEASIVGSTQAQYFRLLSKIVESPAYLISDMDSESASLLARRVEANRSYFEFAADKKAGVRIAFSPEGFTKVQNNIQELMKDHLDDPELSRVVADPLLFVGNGLVARKQWDQADLYFREAIRLYPDHEIALAYLSMVASTKRDFRRAHEYISRLEKFYVGIWPHLLRGRLYMMERNFDKAVISYSRAIEMDPLAMTAHLNKGFSLEAKGLLAEAKASFVRVVALDPKNERALYRLKVLRDSGLK